MYVATESRCSDSHSDCVWLVCVCGVCCLCVCVCVCVCVCGQYYLVYACMEEGVYGGGVFMFVERMYMSG